MVNRAILTHTFHPKMINPQSLETAHGILKCSFVLERQENVKEFLRIKSFINAFANSKRLEIVQNALEMPIEYSKVELTLMLGDQIFIPVFEDEKIKYWLRVIVTNAMGRFQ